MSSSLYPLRFRPQFKEKIWGGRKLAQFLGKDLPENKKIGESWEISAVENNVSEVLNGYLKGQSINELIDEFGEDLLGETVVKTFGKKFPLLIKFLDANDDLSIQVHPNDELALKRHNSLGKSEMWYIIQAEENAQLIKGFNKEIKKDEFLDSIKSNRLEEILQQGSVKANDVFHIPAGTIHNIGKGILLTEIQQTSDITYRISDFDRTDEKGRKRELHVEESVGALNFNAESDFSIAIDVEWNSTKIIVNSDKFITRKFKFNQPFTISYTDSNSFKTLICLKGQAKLSGSFEDQSIKMGDSILLPACITELHLETEGAFEMLETQIP